MNVLIREAAPPDARAMAQMYIASWRAAYRGVVSDAHLDGLGLAERERQWSENISEPECSVVVAVDMEDATSIRGLCSFHAARDEDLSDEIGEISAIYVAPDCWDTGVGRELMRSVLGALTRKGFRAVTLWVLTDNPRARRFYQSAGFGPDGKRVEIRIGDGAFEELRYRRELGGFSVRAAKAEEVATAKRVAELAFETVRPTYRPMGDVAAHEAARAELGTRLVALDGEEIVGTVQLEVHAEHVHLIGLGVLPGLRRRGVARALVEHIALLTPGCERFVIALDTVRETGNVEVFERMGFEVVSDHPTDLFESDRRAELHEVKMEWRLGHETQVASGEARQIR